MRCLCVKTLSASFGVTPGQPVGLTDASQTHQASFELCNGFCPAQFGWIGLGYRDLHVSM